MPAQDFTSNLANRGKKTARLTGSCGKAAERFQRCSHRGVPVIAGKPVHETFLNSQVITEKHKTNGISFHVTE